MLMARKYKRMTNRTVLKLFRKGAYSLKDGTVVNVNGKPIQVSKCHRGYRWVRLYHNGSRRAVSLHRLIWMLANDRVVPRGCHIHHKRGKKHENPEDLECLTKEEHNHARHVEDMKALEDFLTS